MIRMGSYRKGAGCDKNESYCGKAVCDKKRFRIVGEHCVIGRRSVLYESTM